MTVRIDEIIPAGAGWSARVPAGTTIRLIDLEGNQAVDCLLYAAADTTERYSAQETVAWQRSVFLATGSVLRSNRGRPMATVVADGVGRHDTVLGACAKETNVIRYGEETAGAHTCADNFLAEGAAWGLGPRDLGGNINWFMNVAYRPDGRVEIAEGISAPGLSVTFETHLDAIVLLSNCPQVNNPATGRRPSPVRVVVATP